MTINFASKKFILILAIIGFIWAISINEINLAYIKRENPNNLLINSAATMHGYTVWNIDNEWYLSQIKNILAGDGYTVDPHNPELTVRRTPIYPLFYGLHYVLFGEEYSFFVIRYTQVTIHLLAIILLGQAIFNISSNSKWAKLASILYALNPFTIPFLYTTITESLTPCFTIFIIYTFSLCYKKQSYINYFFLGLVTSLSILHRPVFTIWIPAMFLALLIINFKNKNEGSLKLNQGYLILFLLLGLSTLIFPWTVRNYFSTNGDIVFLEKYYYGDPMDYGRGHLKFRDWIGSWENPANFQAETYSNEIRGAYKEGTTDISPITKRLIEKMPNSLFEINSKEDIYNALDSLNTCFAEKYEINKKNPNLTRKEQYSLFTCESVVSQNFEVLIEQYKSKAPLNYYLITPLKIGLSLIFQSGSYPYALLNPIDKQLNPIITGIKGIMYLLQISLLFGCLLFSFYKIRDHLSFKVLSIGLVASTFCLFILVFRYAEARYLIPLYPILYAGLSFILIQIFNKLNLVKYLK